MGMEENNEGFKAGNVHAIGFSLGAHVASFASQLKLLIYMIIIIKLTIISGNEVEKASGSKFIRISGLDPALPVSKLLSLSLCVVFG